MFIWQKCESDALIVISYLLLQMVKAGERASDSEEVDTARLGAQFEQLKSEYGQTPKDGSLYTLFQDFHDTALLKK